MPGADRNILLSCVKRLRSLCNMEKSYSQGVESCKQRINSLVRDRVCCVRLRINLRLNDNYKGSNTFHTRSFLRPSEKMKELGEFFTRVFESPVLELVVCQPTWTFERHYRRLSGFAQLLP